MHSRLFWAAMIVASFICTFWLIASLFDQMNKNPIVIYRDDTAIDVMKVNCWN